MGTMDQLVEDLLRLPPSSFRDELVKKALAGHYHDYKTTVAMPKVELARDLARYGYRNLARRVIRGDYDDEPDQEDHAAIGKLLAENPALAQAWEEMQQTSDPVKAAEILLRAQEKGPHGD